MGGFGKAGPGRDRPGGPATKGIGREAGSESPVPLPAPLARGRGCRREESADGSEVRRETGGKEAVKKREKTCTESGIRKHEKRRAE